MIRIDELPDLLTVKEVAMYLRTTPKTVYVYLSNSGSKGGKKRKRFPDEIRIKIGSDKVLFLKDKFLEWIRNGARFE